MNAIVKQNAVINPDSGEGRNYMPVYTDFIIHGTHIGYLIAEATGEDEQTVTYWPSILPIPTSVDVAYNEGFLAFEASEVTPAEAMTALAAIRGNEWREPYAPVGVAFAWQNEPVTSVSWKVYDQRPQVVTTLEELYALRRANGDLALKLDSGRCPLLDERSNIVGWLGGELPADSVMYVNNFVMNEEAQK